MRRALSILLLISGGAWAADMFFLEHEETGVAYGVRVGEFVQIFTLFYEGIADYLGFDMTHEVQDDEISFTVKTR